ncbi:MAG: hypothetical protein AAB795_04360 [Patescibacteria group bacterium]
MSETKKVGAETKESQEKNATRLLREAAERLMELKKLVQENPIVLETLKANQEYLVGSKEEIVHGERGMMMGARDQDVRDSAEEKLPLEKKMLDLLSSL